MSVVGLDLAESILILEERVSLNLGISMVGINSQVLRISSGNIYHTVYLGAAGSLSDRVGKNTGVLPIWTTKIAASYFTPTGWNRMGRFYSLS